MSRSIIIVESPTKVKSISKFVGPEYVVTSCKGHIRDLPEHELGVNIKAGFKPHYDLIPGSKEIIRHLKGMLNDIDYIYLATDWDREGEAIAWHLVETLKPAPEKIRRITFHEITKPALLQALSSFRSLDENLINAQQARRILDRLVGYKLSPLLWKKVQRGLSAGRVQSVALRLIVDREKEREEFKSEEYWSVTSELMKKDTPPSFKADLFSRGGKKYKKLDIKDEASARSVISDVEKERWVVEDIKKGNKKRSPGPPFITSTMQQESSKKLGFSASKTMLLAQHLYEGVELGTTGSTGLITYMRTDSTTVSASAQKEARKYILDAFGKEYLPSRAPLYKSKVKGAQEAHEAIRPTSVQATPEDVREFLKSDEFKLYKLIWERFVASQMSYASIDTSTVDVAAGDYIFRASGQIIKFPGFLKLYEKDREIEDKVLPPMDKGEELVLKEIKPAQHFTEPLPRYNEASLIKTLEEHGIGRPSTYAPIISTLLRRGYVHLENKRFFPDEIGVLVNSLLVDSFPDIVNLNFTEEVEKKLDMVAEGREKWGDVVQAFYVPFSSALSKAETALQKVSIAEKTEEKCSLCGAPMLLRRSSYGKFLGCSNYPRCRYKVSMNNKTYEETKEKCDKCGSPMVIRQGKRGKFLACSAFPKCRNIKNLKKSDLTGSDGDSKDKG